MVSAHGLSNEISVRLPVMKWLVHMVYLINSALHKNDKVSEYLIS